MSKPSPQHDPQAVWAEVLGYLNFSSGARDCRFLRGLSELFRQAESQRQKTRDSVRLAGDESPVIQLVGETLRAKLAELHASGAGAFRDNAQSDNVLRIAFDEFLPAYRSFHADLLAHQTDDSIYNAFFLGVVLETLLQQGGPWEETPRIVDAALSQLNDFIGHRPVAVLETEQKIEPYSHEYVRPVPLYIAGAGAAAGDYEALVARTITILEQTDRVLLDAAWFDPARLDELAFDPRAYDFNHPANKRPNYHFGQWDPHRIDNTGHFRRFVMQQVTLDGLLTRVSEASDLPADQRLMEAAAVLAGTILMASGTSGSSPETHDSSVTLSKLLPRIAGYRDEFYRQLIARMPADHAQRLQAEATRLKQPFAAARQHLNATLARGRAVQMQHVHLALLFARMGYEEAAMHQASVVPVASARILCQIQCLLSAGDRYLDRGQLRDAVDVLPRIGQLLHLGIENGAIVDPWNILGFSGNYPLFPAVENSVPDLRVDELLELMDDIFSLHARCWTEAATAAGEDLEDELSQNFFELAMWWDRHAAATVGSVRKVFALEAHLSAELVAGALRAWQNAGAAAGDTAFWRPHVETFDYPKAYARVVETLLAKHDMVASMAVLVHWLGQADRVKLEDGHNSFHLLALRWLTTVLADDTENPKLAAQQQGRWKLVRKFFDFLEANAETFWRVPSLDFETEHEDSSRTLLDELYDADDPDGDDDDDEDDEDDEQDLFGAAYDDVIYRDSTNDGFDSEMMESGPSTSDHELESESRRIAGRLSFLATLARLWKRAAVAARADGALNDDPSLLAAMTQWRTQAEDNLRQLTVLMRVVYRYRIAEPTAAEESLIEYDRHRWIKENLLDRIISASVAELDAQRALAGALDRETPPAAPSDAAASETPDVEHQPTEERSHVIGQLWRALLHRDVPAARRVWPKFLEAIKDRPLLYVPLGRGGDPLQILTAKSTQQLLRELLDWLPRLGMLVETCQLIAAAQTMEKNQTFGAGAVTEFDRLFEIGYKSIVESLIESANGWTHMAAADPADGIDAPLVECLQQLTEALLNQWLTHSRGLRLSVLEKINSKAYWKSLVAFIERYGHDLFTQRFLNLGNLRAILHQGVERWLERLEESPDEYADLKLLDDLGESLPREDAKRHLSLVLESIVENYSEYRDYNSSTTQSDKGELLHVLLDFLRIKVGYERVNWNLRPVVMAHEVLVRQGRVEAAESWRRAMAERTAEAADQHWQRYLELQTKHGMKLPTIAARLSERFVRPLMLDRIRSLVQPAVDEARAGEPPMAFSLLEQEAGELAQEPGGSGLDMPDWLLKLEEEVDHACSPSRRSEQQIEAAARVPIVRLSYEEVQQQMANWTPPPE